MHRSGRKNPRLQEKLQALEREIVRMETDIKAMSRVVDTPDSEHALRKLKSLGGNSSHDDSLRRPAPYDAGRMENLPATSSLQNRVEDVLPENAAPVVPKTTPDQRFNTYFGSGSLHSVRPLRQERRVQRNKAIFMLVMAALLISFVLKMIF